MLPLQRKSKPQDSRPNRFRKLPAAPSQGSNLISMREEGQERDDRGHGPRPGATAPAALAGAGAGARPPSSTASSSSTLTAAVAATSATSTAKRRAKALVDAAMEMTKRGCVARDTIKRGKSSELQEAEAAVTWLKLLAGRRWTLSVVFVCACKCGNCSAGNGRRGEGEFIGGM